MHWRPVCGLRQGLACQHSTSGLVSLHGSKHKPVLSPSHSLLVRSMMGTRVLNTTLLRHYLKHARDKVVGMPTVMMRA